MTSCHSGNGHFQQRLMRAHGHIADQNIDAAQGVNALGDHIGYAVGVGHIADDGVRTDAQGAALGGYAFQFRRRLAGVQDQVGALAGEGAGDFGADVAAGAGDEGGFVVQAHLGYLSFRLQHYGIGMWRRKLPPGRVPFG